jgi:hypothetical protein
MTRRHQNGRKTGGKMPPERKRIRRHGASRNIARTVSPGRIGRAARFRSRLAAPLASRGGWLGGKKIGARRSKRPAICHPNLGERCRRAAGAAYRAANRPDPVRSPGKPATTPKGVPPHNLPAGLPVARTAARRQAVYAVTELVLCDQIATARQLLRERAPSI